MSSVVLFYYHNSSEFIEKLEIKFLLEILFSFLIMYLILVDNIKSKKYQHFYYFSLQCVFEVDNVIIMTNCYHL